MIYKFYGWGHIWENFTTDILKIAEFTSLKSKLIWTVIRGKSRNCIKNSNCIVLAAKPTDDYTRIMNVKTNFKVYSKKTSFNLRLILEAH